MTAKEYTTEEFAHLLVSEHGEDASRVQRIVERWLERGDGAAVYENQDFGHPQMGHKQIVSFGSHDAQLETEEPPERLPDVGGKINWRYTLIGTYRWATPQNERYNYEQLRTDERVQREEDALRERVARALGAGMVVTDASVVAVADFVLSGEFTELFSKLSSVRLRVALEQRKKRLAGDD